MPLPETPAVLETALYARDLDAARDFYHRVLGLEVVLEQAGRHVFFRVAGGMLLVFDPDAAAAPGEGPLAAPAHGAEGPGHVCLGAPGDALTAWEAWLSAHGVAIEARITWPNGARSIYVRDPAGNSVEFAEPFLWGVS